MSTSARRGSMVSAAMLSLVLARPALAHPGHLGSSFGDGWWHPLSGPDHLLAMIAVGLLAVRLGGWALWMLPGGFLAGMLAGAAAAMLGLACPGVESGMVTSVLVFGLLVAAGQVVSLPAALAAVVLFATLHGYAHAAEMIAGGAFAAYAAGFLLATTLLHAGGILGGVALSRGMQPRAIRAAGGAIAAAGMLLSWGLMMQ